MPGAPNPDLRRLDVLVGAWTVSGRYLDSQATIAGKVAFEWMDGGFFLVQRVDLDHAGQRVTGIEIIGHEQPWGAEAPGADVTSHFFDNQGNHFEYVWDVGDDTLTIWGGHRGSAARFTGRFSDDRNTIIGRWEWPGGGYEATMTRVGGPAAKGASRQRRATEPVV